jgi:hypothetical protein
MSISPETRLAVRQRADFVCEFCGVSEIDSAGELTVDHFHPKIRGGTDDLTNLLYCCVRCNQYKADYWSGVADAPKLWNPRQEALDVHLLLLADGTLYPVTPTGEFTLHRLRLNRVPLVAYRLRKQQQSEELGLLTRYQETVRMLEQLHEQQIALLEEQRSLLNEQQRLLRILIGL